ncbi:hypothetical protein [Mitsuaria sp. GD03876]|uniref:hypothetical protein n=1 Tax=Mitsuaria sp. GD03876 TaxID=2975399 RepID=UPI00244AB26A|nr:hypothetical protein [Mitsuaria sp. GD03876]MDH0863352.1 hypothetical protein [Mitsuaria sp. GD03876]
MFAPSPIARTFRALPLVLGACAAHLAVAGSGGERAPESAAEPAIDARVFEGYDAFYASLPDPLFSPEDELKVIASGASGRAGDVWRWKTARRSHVLELHGADMVVDGRRLPAAAARRFEDEAIAPALGRSATVYANETAVCVEGVPASASGTAVRHVRVSLVMQPYTAQARRFELPSLFASCRGLSLEPDGAIGFFRNRYRWPENAPAPLGITFEGHALRNGRFAPNGQALQATFVEAGNVYRFTSP